MSNAIFDAIRRLRSVLVVALGLVTMAGLAACGGDGGDDGTSSDTASSASAQGLPSAGGQGGAMMEMRQLQKQLSSISEQAMQDTALQQQLQEVRDLINQTVRDMSPEAARTMDRMDSIRGQLQTAQTQGDTARLRSLIMEAQKLQGALQKYEAKAMQQEDVAAAVKEFQNALREQMREVNPDADSLMDRADSLRQEMQNQAQGMLGGSDTASDTAGG